jgi:iron complex outermembrane receptor protein
MAFQYSSICPAKLPRRQFSPSRVWPGLVPLVAALLLTALPARAQTTVNSSPVGSGGNEATALESIVVEASGTAALSAGSLGSFFSAPLESMPLAIDTIHAAELLERGVNSLSAAIRTEPSAGDNYNTFGYVEALQVRGFALNELLNYQRDAMPVSSHVPVALENKESIEILKGASGMLAGSSAPGGLVNYVLKQPTATALAQVDSTISERGSALLHGDFGGHLGSQGAFGYRINLAAEERRPEIDHAWSKRTLLSGFFDWHAAPGTLLQIEFEHQKVREISVPAFALVDSANVQTATTIPAPIDPRLNLNAQPWTLPFESTASSTSLRLEQKLATDWVLALRGATQRSVTNDRIAFPDGCSYVNAGLNSNLPAPGNYYLLNGLCSNYNVDIYQYVSNDEVRNTNGFDAHVNGRISLAGAGHDITAGIKTTRYSERYPPLQAYNYVGTESVFAPIAFTANATLANPNADLDTDLDELYAFDVAHFARRWSTWLGARYTRITENSALVRSAYTTTLEATRLQQHFVTPWLGLGYAPWTGGFAYASAGSGVEVASVANKPQFANPGQALPAQRSHQVELGFKQHAGASWSWDATLFRITKPFADNVGTVAGLLQVASAREERHQGLELTGDWQPLAGLQLRASTALIDAKTTHAVNPDWVGKAATNVAPVSASLQETWSPGRLPGLAWSNIWTYAGHKTVLPDGSVDLPSYWQWDTSVRYAIAAGQLRWVWRAGIDNLTARTYWREAPTTSYGSTYLFPAAARSARLGVSLSW